jgi:hypothetical protein
MGSSGGLLRVWQWIFGFSKKRKNCFVAFKAGCWIWFDMFVSAHNYNK